MKWGGETHIVVLEGDASLLHGVSAPEVLCNRKSMSEKKVSQQKHNWKSRGLYPLAFWVWRSTPRNRRKRFFLLCCSAGWWHLRPEDWPWNLETETVRFHTTKRPICRWIFELLSCRKDRLLKWLFGFPKSIQALVSVGEMRKSALLQYVSDSLFLLAGIYQNRFELDSHPWRWWPATAPGAQPFRCGPDRTSWSSASSRSELQIAPWTRWSPSSPYSPSRDGAVKVAFEWQRSG